MPCRRQGEGTKPAGRNNSAGTNDPVYVICLGFIAGSWDHRYQSKSPRGWENGNLGQISEAPPRRTYPRLNAETPHSEDAIVPITLSVQKAYELSKATTIVSETLTEYKGVELSDKGK